MAIGKQARCMVLHNRLTECNRRSPSPAPQYDNLGRRVNTREFRYRKRLEEERHKLIEKAMKTIPNYHPPQDYRRPTKTQEKVYVPVNDYPEINFSMVANSLILNYLLSLGRIRGSALNGWFAESNIDPQVMLPRHAPGIAV